MDTGPHNFESLRISKKERKVGDNAVYVHRDLRELGQGADGFVKLVEIQSKDRKHAKSFALKFPWGVEEKIKDNKVTSFLERSLDIYRHFKLRNKQLPKDQQFSIPPTMRLVCDKETEAPIGILTTDLAEDGKYRVGRGLPVNTPIKRGSLKKFLKTIQNDFSMAAEDGLLLYTDSWLYQYDPGTHEIRPFLIDYGGTRSGELNRSYVYNWEEEMKKRFEWVTSGATETDSAVGWFKSGTLEGYDDDLVKASRNYEELIADYKFNESLEQKGITPLRHWAGSFWG